LRIESRYRQEDSAMNPITKTIRLSANLRQLAGAREGSVDLPPGATVADLLAALGKSYPALADFVRVEDGGLQAGVQVVIDGRHIEFLQGIESPVAQAQDVMLIPPLAGG
jgi:molybdopterin synthase sulfur carrier subunit